MRIISLIPLLMLLDGPSWAQDAYGIWKMNPGRSGSIRSDLAITVRIEPHVKGEVFTYERTTRDGHADTLSVVLYFDGRERSSQFADCVGTLLSRRLDNGVVEIIWRCESGRLVRFVRRLANPRDLILDETETQPNRAGSARHLVLEKQQASERP